MDQVKGTILVKTSNSVTMRGRTSRTMKVEVLGKNINLFVAQIGSILDNTPEKIKKFRLTEISVTAEVSAKGGLVLLGTGIETEGKGGITFVFTKT